MYKVGDKVETPLGIGKVSISAHGYMVNIKGYEVVFNKDVIKPYITAHDKLLAMGFRLKQNSKTKKVYSILQHSIEIEKYEDEWKYYTNGIVIGLSLSRILTQLLEEME